MKIQALDFSVDLTQAVLWQYSSTTHLLGLINAKQAWYNAAQSDFWDGFYQNIFNLRTANLFGISVWSYILNLPFFVTATDPPGKPIWGFNEVLIYPAVLNDYVNFTHGTFGVSTGIVNLSVEQQRFILRLHAYQIANRGAIPEINAFLSYLCADSAAFEPGQTIYVLDNFDMTITYVSNFVLPSNLDYVLKTFELFPRPAGVGILYDVV